MKWVNKYKKLNDTIHCFLDIFSSIFFYRNSCIDAIVFVVQNNWKIANAQIFGSFSSRKITGLNVVLCCSFKTLYCFYFYFLRPHNIYGNPGRLVKLRVFTLSTVWFNMALHFQDWTSSPAYTMILRSYANVNFLSNSPC